MRSEDLAEYILYKCNQIDKSINNLKLQYMLFFVQMEFEKNKKNAFFDDIICGQFPKISIVYYKYCCYGSLLIKIFKDNHDYNSIDEKNLIDKVIDENIDSQIWELSEKYKKIIKTKMPNFSQKSRVF